MSIAWRRMGVLEMKEERVSSWSDVAKRMKMIGKGKGRSYFIG